MRVIFPLLTEIGFHPDNNAWIYPMGHDAAALHINAFAVQSFIDRVLRQQPDDMVNPVATLHHQKGLKILRERLLGDNDDAKISDGTISTVLKLAGAAQFDGNGETAKYHMQGLRRMVDLRGGLDVFEDKPKLLVEILRCDLALHCSLTLIRCSTVKLMNQCLTIRIRWFQTSVAVHPLRKRRSLFRI